MRCRATKAISWGRGGVTAIPAVGLPHWVLRLGGGLSLRAGHLPGFAQRPAGGLGGEWGPGSLCAAPLAPP